MVVFMLINMFFNYHYNLGLSENGYDYHLNRNDRNLYGNSLHLSALYDMTKKLSIGIGMGADRYEPYNTFPVFATLHYRPTFQNLPGGYAYTNIGYAIVNNDNVSSGLVWGAGIGYLKMFRRHFGLNFQFGYDLKQFADIPTYEVVIPDNAINYLGEKSSIRHSLSFGIGLVF